MLDDQDTKRTWQSWVDQYQHWVEEHELNAPDCQPIHAIAIITLRRTEDGGRSTPICSGYRGQFYYDAHDWDAQYIFDTDGWIQPGEAAEAILQFISPWAHQGHLPPGKAFLIREGSHVVGQGQITWVDEALR